MNVEGKQALINYLRDANSHTTLKLLDLFSYDELKGFEISPLVIDEVDVSQLYPYIYADSRLLRLFPNWVKTRYNIHNSVSVDDDGIDSYLDSIYSKQDDYFYDDDYDYYFNYDRDDFYEYESDYMDLMGAKDSRHKQVRGLFRSKFRQDREYMSVRGYMV